MKSRWILALFVVAVGAAVWGGRVLATTATKMSTSQVAKSWFGGIDF